MPDQPGVYDPGFVDDTLLTVKNSRLVENSGFLTKLHVLDGVRTWAQTAENNDFKLYCINSQSFTPRFRI